MSPTSLQGLRALGGGVGEQTANELHLGDQALAQGHLGHLAHLLHLARQAHALLGADRSERYETEQGYTGADELRGSLANYGHHVVIPHLTGGQRVR